MLRFFRLHFLIRHKLIFQSFLWIYSVTLELGLATISAFLLDNFAFYRSWSLAECLSILVYFNQKQSVNKTDEFLWFSQSGCWNLKYSHVVVSNSIYSNVFEIHETSSSDFTLVDLIIAWFAKRKCHDFRWFKRHSYIYIYKIFPFFLLHQICLPL